MRKDQRQGSHAIGVNVDTISSWERGARGPALEYMPKVIEFLGYVPFDTCKTLGKRIRLYRMSHGLTVIEFAKKLGVAHQPLQGGRKIG